MKKTILKGNLWGAVLGVLLFSSCGVLTGDGSKASVNPTEDTTTEGGTGANPAVQGGSSTTVSNPIIFNLKDASGLVLKNEDKDNLKKLIDGSLESVFEINASAATVSKGNVAQEIPGVSSFVQGPNNELIVWLKNPISIDDQSCSTIYYRESDDKTICAPSMGTPQFDSAGNVYFISGVVKKWDPNKNETINITNENLSINKWLVHASGDIFFNGSALGINIFRRVNVDGSAEDYLDGTASIYAFRFVDRNHILMKGHRVKVDDSRHSGTFLLTVLGPNKGQIEILDFPVDFNPEYDLDSAQQASNGVFYARNDSYSYTTNGVVAVFPGTPYSVPLNLTGLRAFKVIDLNLYASGQRGTKHVLVLSRLNENGVAQDLLGEASLEVYDFILVNEMLYFNALRLADNKVIFGEIDLNTRSLSVIDDSIGKQFLKMELRKSIRNESFSAMDDVRDLVLPPFITEQFNRDVFAGLGKVYAVKRLNGDYSQYMAVIADTKIHFFDMTNPNSPQHLSEKVIDESSDVNLLQNIYQTGNRVYVQKSSIYNGFFTAFDCLTVDDINNPILITNGESRLGFHFVSYRNIMIQPKDYIGLSSDPASKPVWWDFSNPSNTSVKDFVDLQSGIQYDPRNFFSAVYFGVTDEELGMVYLLAKERESGRQGVYSFDFSDPENIKLLSFSPLDVIYGGMSNGAYDGDNLYLGALSIINVGSRFETVNKLSETTIWNSNLKDVSIFGSYSFFQSGKQIFLVDIENLQYPRLRQIINMDKVNSYSVVKNSESQYTVYVGTDNGLVELHLTRR